jgi:hypothetical protein
MRCRKFIGVNFGRGAAHTTLRFKPIHTATRKLTNKPVTRRHRPAILEQGYVPDHDRITTLVTHDDIEGSRRRTAQQLLDPLKVIDRSTP